MIHERFSKGSKEVNPGSDEQESSGGSNAKDADTDDNDGKREDAGRGTRAKQAELLLNLTQWTKRRDWHSKAKNN